MKYQTGFTLVELLLVVGIISILAAIGIAQYQGFVLRTQLARAYSEINTLRNSVEICENNANEQEQCLLDSVDSDMLITEPEVSYEPPEIHAEFGSNAHNLLRGGKIDLTRNEDGVWSCSIDVPSGVDHKYIPKACQ